MAAPPAVKDFYAERKTIYEKKSLEDKSAQVVPQPRKETFFEERWMNLMKGNDSFS